MSDKKDHEDEAPESETESLGFEGDGSLDEFLAQFSPAGGYQFQVYRLEPKQHVIGNRTRKIGGHLETLMVPPSLDEIRQSWGGGVYDVRVTGPKKDNKRGWIRSCRVEIAGDPRLKPEHMVDDGPAQAPTDVPPWMKSVIDQMAEDKRRLEERVDRLSTQLADRSTSEATGAKETAEKSEVVRAVERQATAQLSMLSEQLQRRDQEVAELRREMHGRTSPFENPELLKVLFGQKGDDTTRLAELHRQQVDAERQRHASELEAERRAHQQMVAMIERGANDKVEMVRTTLDQLIRSKDAEIARLTEELRSARKEVKEAKPATGVDEVQRVGQMIEAVRRLTPEGTSAEPSKSGWDRLLDVLVNKFGDGILNTIQNAQAQAQAQAPAPAPRPRPPMRPVYVVAPPGTVPGPRVPPAQAQAQAQPATGTPPVAPGAVEEVPAQEAAAPSSEAIGMDESVTVQGLDFIETAMRNGQSPQNVAVAAARLFGRQSLAQLASAPIDAIMAQIEQVAPQSVLLTTGGRRFVVELIDVARKQNTG